MRKLIAAVVVAFVVFACGFAAGRLTAPPKTLVKLLVL